MSKYIYEPDTNWWTDSDIVNFFNKYGSTLKRFFNLHDVRKYVDSNNWKEVFEEWESHWRIVEPLAFFLHHFVHIDFMPYIGDPTNYHFGVGSLKKVED